MELWTALALGFVGSLHCAGMCGPLALALPVTGNTRRSYVAGRLMYNAGRIMTYALLGVVFGLIGQTLAVAGLQRWVSLAIGIGILLSVASASRFSWGGPLGKGVMRLKAALAALWQKRSLTSLFALGLLNGLLPCGLVYVAAATATTAASFLGGAAYMAVFGLGTLPLMLGMSLAGRRFQMVARLNPARLIPLSLVIVGTLLVLRGLSLGIPYLSPEIANGTVHCPHCEQ